MDLPGTLPGIIFMLLNRWERYVNATIYRIHGAEKAVTMQTDDPVSHNQSVRFRTASYRHTAISSNRRRTLGSGISAG